MFYLFILLAIAVAIVCLHLQNSRIGRAWIAIREDEIAAKAMDGYQYQKHEIACVCHWRFFCWSGGCIVFRFPRFCFSRIIHSLGIYCGLGNGGSGGIGHIPGMILGAVLLAVFPEILRVIAQPVQQFLFGHVIVDVEIIRQLIYGLALILIMLYRPGGIWQKSGARQ